MGVDLLQGKGIRLYNLFPRLVGSMARWRDELPRIRDLGFNAIWVNPFHYPGFSGSLYSPKDYYKFNPLFIDGESSPNEQLRETIEACHKNGQLFIMDLVINHTAIDCTLVLEHPAWYCRKPDGKIVNPGAWNDGKWIEWGDLAEIDNACSSDRQNLWNFWWKMMAHYLDLGVDGFRCDAAYQVPDDLWRFLIERSRQKKPGCLFLAESLGCSFQQVEQLARLGFDYIFNSSKYWDFNEPWGMEQYIKTSPVVASVSFPESHDTPRLRQELNDDMAAVRRRFLFAALFSKGIMMPIGFEWGYQRSLNVVETMPHHRENSGADLSDFVRSVLRLKDTYPALNREEGLTIVDQDNWYNIFCFRRFAPGQKMILVAMNKDRSRHQRLYLPDLERILGAGKVIDISPENAIPSVSRVFDYNLRPCEIKVLAGE
ncbi:MAG: alpha-amylase [Candidatus Riflebacteria bacterium]|nr:alpha-amylase [Candidatus Riflebacteria bacterium]